MERCSKCNGVMLEMKVKKTLLPDAERKQVFKCSRCGYYVEKPQTFASKRFNNQPEDEPPIYRHSR